MDNLTLSQLNSLIKGTLEKNLDTSYWVVAEIGELRVNAKGHCYLELIEKEENTVLAKARATIWSYTYRNLSAWFQSFTGSELQAGMRILANLQVTFHEVYGFNLNIKDIDASFTLGEREKKRQETIKQLEKDGVLDMNKLLELPLVPKVISVISSPTAAGFEDFTQQLENNPFGYKFNSKLFPATMQGEAAPESIIGALHKIIDSRPATQLIVLIRGGGATMDLDCFDDYELTSHLAQVPIPVITGIGHERDQSISDLVAHTALKTPTAVAEFLINGIASFEAEIEDRFNNIGQIARDRISQENLIISDIIGRLKLQSQAFLNDQHSQISQKAEQLKYKSKLLLSRELNGLESIEAQLQLLNPLKVLHRGYTFTTHNGKSISDSPVKPNDTIKTYTEKEIITSTVKKTDTYGES